MGSFCFLKKERLLKRKEFVNVNRSGRRYTTEHFTIFLKENGLGISRLGVTVTKRTGTAVERNRMKRLIREFFRLHRERLPQGHDIVIAARKNASNLDLWKVKEELGTVLFDKKHGA
jgi:ribonuclease P protein component